MTTAPTPPAPATAPASVNAPTDGAADAPILVLQMQRMGDLVLTFPLLAWLRAEHPRRPLWVVGEEKFFKGLMPIGPEAVFFPYGAAERLRRNRYHLVVNLSHRPEAAALAGQLHADAHFGPYLAGGDTGKGTGQTTYVHGRWQLYRTSLVHNNRHNLFHWADLNALDCVPHSRIRGTDWPAPQHQGRDPQRVGLFLGASEPEKRPGAPFWAALARDLLRRGLKPVLLGGPAEAALGADVARRANTPALNLCGRFTLPELVAFTRSLRLLVTPDTGPMHVAAWTQTPTLNLSMGPVNAWETAPFPPGHHVLRATISCVGCWRCTQPSVLCRDRFDPARVASLVHALLREQDAAPTLAASGAKAATAASRLARLRLPGLELLRTGRDALGLFDLVPMGHNGNGEQAVPRRLFGQFWKAFWSWRLGLHGEAAARRAWADLAAASPHLAEALRRALSGLGRDLAHALRGMGSGQAMLPPDFWHRHPPMLRPLTGYLHMSVQNADATATAWAEALALVEALAALTA
uniref:Glycosyl transferase family 9 n=1 Tax=Nitratidesulfovibrio vulgaris (strain DSM 19637 / Miyazaki F) TaxID=883 RepID=B8DPB9_NITV9